MNRRGAPSSHPRHRFLRRLVILCALVVVVVLLWRSAARGADLRVRGEATSALPEETSLPSDESAFEAKAFSSKQEREREAALRLLTRRLQDMETARVVDSTEARVGRPLSEEARKRYRLPSDQVTFFTNTRYRAIRAPDAREQQDIRNLIQETFDSPLFSAAEQRAELREKFLTSYLNYTRNFMIVAQSWADMNVMKSSILITSYNVNEFGRRLASGREIAPSEARGRQQFYLSGPISGTNQHESLDREAARERYGYLFSKGHPSNPQDGPSILKGIGVEP